MGVWFNFFFTLHVCSGSVPYIHIKFAIHLQSTNLFPDCILKFTCRHYRISELVIALSSSPSMSEIHNCFLWDERQRIFECQDFEEIISASRLYTWLANMNAIISTYNYEYETFSWLFASNLMSRAYSYVHNHAPWKSFTSFNKSYCA